MAAISILVVDDHSIIRQGIRSLLSNYPEFEVIGEAANGPSALSQIVQQQPDVTLLDIRLPGESGVEVLKRIRQTQPEAKVLMLTSFNDDEYVMSALRAGALGYVLKSSSDEMLVNAIRATHQGEHFLSPKIAGAVVRRSIAGPARFMPDTPAMDGEERRILKMLVDGASNTDIAAELFISNATVKRKLRKIFEKLNVNARAQAAAEAIRRNLV
ncbi:MAG: response regulator transcription factor [Anaerolineae bacterium]|nr:response regulator transcription factor [Anaerolineae bacterium]